MNKLLQSKDFIFITLSSFFSSLPGVRNHLHMQKRDSKSFDTCTLYKGDLDDTETTITAATASSSNDNNRITSAGAAAHQNSNDNFSSDRAKNETRGDISGAFIEDEKIVEQRRTVESQNEVWNKSFFFPFLFSVFVLLP